MGSEMCIRDRVEELAAYVPDYSYVLGELLSLLHQIATVQTLGDVQHGNVHDEKRLQGFAKSISPQDVQLWYQTGITGRRDMPYAPDQRQALEMILIRMLAFKPFVEGAQVSSAVAASTEATTATTTAAKPATRPTSATTARVQSAPTADQTTRHAPPAPPAAAPPEQAPSPEQAKEQQPQLPPANLKWKSSQWQQILSAIPVSGMPLQLGRNCILHSVTKDQVHLHLCLLYTSPSPRDS